MADGTAVTSRRRPAERSEVSFLGRELRGAAVVATMAEIENLLREMLVLVAREVNASGTPVRDMSSRFGCLQPIRRLRASAGRRKWTSAGISDTR